MKVHVVFLCICLMQICSGLNNTIDENQLKQKIRDTVNGTSERFVDDLVFILKKMENNRVVQRALGPIFLETLSEIPIGKEEWNTKTDIKILREKFYMEHRDAEQVLTDVDALKALHTKLSEHVPPERLNGIRNVNLLLTYTNATTEEFESVMNYLYGTGPTETTMTLLNIPDPTAVDCPRNVQKYNSKIDKLKLMVDIRQKVIEDMISIRDKFPCSFLSDQIEGFFEFMKKLHGDQTKIDVCTMEKNLYNWDDHPEWEYLSEVFEYLSSARLTDETYGGMMNVLKATKVGTSKDEIQKALEYLYDDVPVTKCES